MTKVAIYISMTRFNRHIVSVLTVIAVMCLHNGCVEHLENDMNISGDNVSYTVSLDGNRTSVPTKGYTGCLDFEEEEWVLELDTKAGLLNSLNGLEAGVYGYVYSGEWNVQNAPLEFINGDKFTFDGDRMDADEPVRWSVVEEGLSNGYKFRTFVYAPKGDTAPTLQSQSKGAPVINVESIKSFQKDIVVADKEVVIDISTNNHRKDIQLDFEHIFTAIQFKAGFDCTITGISIEGIKTGGKYIVGTGWTELGGSSVELDFPVGVPVLKGKDIGVPVLMIPQIFESGAKIKLTYSETGESETTIEASLDGVEWKQGKKITYTLMKESDRKYIYLDLAAGNVVISGTSYSGYRFVNKTATYFEGTIVSGQKYYIYQSCTENTESPNYKTGDSGSTFTKPSYPAATRPDGTLWSDFITNNDNVEEVINAWDNKTGATDNTGINNDMASRRAGRESTKNTIHISGNVGTCNVIIDNIYCSHQHKGQNRSFGSISFIPTWNTGSSLILHLIGDNRLGCLHYDNNTADSSKGSDNVRKQNTNRLIIEGEGSLTVADADFYESGGGYYSNHYDSAIGNSDSRNSTYGIVINSGTIYAGTTAAENSSAIGAGGNGYGDVVINGGVVTAVASTTGTAIGGGIGFSDTGGLGYVEINGGNIYAYNHQHSSNIPSSAIGGAGSRDKPGSKGTVIITGGNVYAQSALGTAIGGGSSKTQNGGEGNVTITGGNVIAKSLSPISAGIGGGSTCTGGGSLSTPNGGTAVITIGDKSDPSKNPILRTGSIGGGGTNATGGTVGNAQIYVYGGDVQAQFVMAKSTGNVFEMDGGLIRNSSTSDDTYYCIKEHGGAVYMEQGTFTMSGGVIKGCMADKNAGAKGGAVYIKGDQETSFTMKGGEIRECRANADGGAVYLEGGTVTISGGTIDGNVAYDGNGGAVSILGGSFTMDGETASITQNTAFDRGSGTKGNGGGIYVAPAAGSSSTINITLKKGNIEYNSSDRNGGGVCVDMGSNKTAELNVNVGVVSGGDATNSLSINGNNALIKGGGMYIKGEKASVRLNDGYVLANSTSSYQVNPDIAVEGGLVTLMKPGITTQVTITFSNNAQYYTQGETDDDTVDQYIVAASLSQFNANPFEAINGYYDTFKGWNTRRDGKGTAYSDEAVTSLNESITLFAQWE